MGSYSAGGRWNVVDVTLSPTYSVEKRGGGSIVEDPLVDMTPQERAAVVAWRLAYGAEMTTQEIAECTGLTVRRARGLVCELSRVIPIHNIGGLWQHALMRRDGLAGYSNDELMEMILREWQEWRKDIEGNGK